MDAYVNRYVEGKNFSGAVLIAHGGKILLAKGYGMANYELGVPNTPRTKFHIASTSKPFTAAGILLLEERGALRVEDPLSKYVADYPNGDKITIHHLLTHTSGIPDVNRFPEYDRESKFPHTPAQLIDLFKNKPLDFQPGERYGYSNSNYNLLAYIIEKVSGKRYGEFLRENIFAPLVMKDTGHDGDSAEMLVNRASGYVPAGLGDVANAPYLDWSIKTGNGSLYSTVEDLYKWDRALYTDGVLNASSRAKMFQDYGARAGYGWFVRQRFGRRGAAINGRSPGFTSSLERFVNDDLCIIVLSNNYSGIASSLAGDVTAIVFGEKPQAVLPPTAVAVNPMLLASYAGRYQFGPDFAFNPGQVVTVENSGGQLRVNAGAGGVSYLIPQGENQFLDRLFGGIVTFGKDAAGSVTQLTWSFGRDFVANRIPPTEK